MSTINTLRSLESAAVSNQKASFYRGEGIKFSSNSLKRKRRKRGFALISLIALLIAGGGLVSVFTNSHLLNALDTLTTVATDTQSAALTKRFPHLIARMMRGGESDQGYNSLPNTFRERLTTNGITASEDGSSLIYKNQTITADNLIETYNNNSDFYEATSNSRFGNAANYFDESANQSYLKNGTTRNIYSNYQQTGSSQTNDKNYKSLMSERFDNNQTDISIRRQGDVLDEEGNTVFIEEVDSDSAITKSSTSNTDARTQASNYISNIAGRAARVTNGTCAYYRAGNLIAVAIAANEMYQSMQFFLNTNENFSKTKAGYGAQAAANEALNRFTNSTTTSTQNYNNPSFSFGENSTPEISINETEPITGSPLESNGLQYIFANHTPNKQTTNNYSLERISRVLISAFAAGGTTNILRTCAVAQGGTSLATLAISIVPGVGQVSILGSFILDLVVTTGITIAIGSFLSFLIPTLAETLFTNKFDNLSGVNEGEEYSRGSSIANTILARNTSGQMPTSKDKVINYNKLRQEVATLEAEVDRKNRSPIDISSPNTFLGHITYSLLPFGITSNSSALNSVMQTTARAITSTITGVSADGEGSNYLTTFNECPDIENLGGSGELYCVPITTTDTSTIDINPDDPTYLAIIEPNLECDDGNCTIVQGSEMGKFNSYCMNRKSPFGILDSNILSELEVSSFISGLPVIGDVFDIINTGIALENLGWATGSNCINSEENERWDSEIKYYQRYYEDQRLLTQMGVYTDSENPVTAYERIYLENHPLDYSPSGYLATITGMSKSSAEDIIAVAEYYNYLANYNPNSTVNLQTIGLSGAENAKFAKSQHLLFNQYQYNDLEVHGSQILAFIYSDDLRNRAVVG